MTHKQKKSIIKKARLLRKMSVKYKLPLTTANIDLLIGIVESAQPFGWTVMPAELMKEINEAF